MIAVNCKSRGISKGLIASFLGVVCLIGVVCTAPIVFAGPTITGVQLDTANDLFDIGGGTNFNGNIEGNGGTFGYLSGNFPWVENGGVALYDNNTNTWSYGQWEDDLYGLVGTLEMPSAYRLSGFSITIRDLRQDGYTFTIQGSNDSTNGWQGTWTDIFEVSSYSVSANQTYRWNSDENTFLSSLPYKSFRLINYAPYKRFAQIEFFGPAVPEATVIIIK